jgi:hypothetical protein
MSDTRYMMTNGITRSPPGKPGIDLSNETQVRLVLAQQETTISTLRQRVEALTQDRQDVVNRLQQVQRDGEWQLALLAEMIERSGIEPVPHNPGEVIALRNARTFLEAQRNKIIERVETALGKDIDRGEHNVND